MWVKQKKVVEGGGEVGWLRSEKAKSYRALVKASQEAVVKILGLTA